MQLSKVIQGHSDVHTTFCIETFARSRRTIYCRIGCCFLSSVLFKYWRCACSRSIVGISSRFRSSEPCSPARADIFKIMIGRPKGSDTESGRQRSNGRGGSLRLGYIVSMRQIRFCLMDSNANDLVNLWRCQFRQHATAIVDTRNEPLRTGKWRLWEVSGLCTVTRYSDTHMYPQTNPSPNLQCPHSTAVHPEAAARLPRSKFSAVKV